MSRRNIRTLLPMLPVLALCGCAGAANIKTVKAPDYNKVPQRLLVAIPPASPLNLKFQQALASALAKCGTTAQFIPAFSLPAAKEGHFDGIIQTTPLGQETTTLTNRYGSNSYVSAVRVEFSLYETETTKNVWKEQIDFTNNEGSLVLKMANRDKEEAWANALLESMTKNGLVGSCDAAHAVAQPAQLFYASTTPLAPSAIGTPTKVTFSVEGVKYDSADAALDAMRASAERKVAQTAPAGLKTYDPLLFVLPTEDEIRKSSIRISGLANEADFDKFTVGSREIQYDSFAQAFRRTTLFKSVETARSDEIKPGEFRGSRYKLWFSKPEGKTPGSWVVASSTGGEQRFQLASGDRNDVQSMVMKLQAALDNLPQ